MRRRTILILLVLYLLLLGEQLAFNIYTGRWVAAFELLVGLLLVTLYEVYVPERLRLYLRRRLRLRMPGLRPRPPVPPAAPLESTAPPAPVPPIRRAVPGPEDG